MKAADVLALIADVAYITFPATAGSAPTTCCRITTASGYSIVATSTPAKPEHFDEAIGQRQAYDRAVRELVELERYARRAEAAS